MSKPPRIGDRGRKAETKLSKRLGYQQTPASGAAMQKGDMANEHFLLEAKSTTSDRFSLTLSNLAKIHGEALMAGKLPAFAVQFTDLSGRAVQNGSWVAVPEWVWQQLILKEEG